MGRVVVVVAVALAVLAIVTMRAPSVPGPAVSREPAQREAESARLSASCLAAEVPALPREPLPAPLDRRASHLTGVVVDTAGRPFAQLWIRLAPETRQGAAQRAGDHHDVTADDEGRFAVPELPLGRWCIEVFDIDCEGYCDLVAPSCIVVRESSATVRIVVRRLEPLRGVVVDGTGAPVAGAPVVFVAPGFDDPSWRGRRTDADGRFVVRPLGDVPLQFMLRVGPTPTHEHLEPGPAFVWGQRIRLVVERAVTRQLRIRVVWADDGRPVPHSEVWLESEAVGGNVRWCECVDADAVAVTPVRPGPVYLFACYEGTPQGSAEARIAVEHDTAVELRLRTSH